MSSTLVETARLWVRDTYHKNADHLLKAEEWLGKIAPDAAQAVVLATLTHDMERAFPGPDSPKADPALGPDDPLYNQAHSDRSARIVSAFLQEQQTDAALVAEVARLIRAHEFGGWSEADQVQASDSLSFLEVNVDLFLKRIGAAQDSLTPDQVRSKFDWMYDRIKIPEARVLASPLYVEAIKKMGYFSTPKKA